MFENLIGFASRQGSSGYLEAVETPRTSYLWTVDKCSKIQQFLVLVDPKDPYFVHARKLGNNQDQQHSQIESHWLLPEIAAMRGQQKRHNGYCREKLPIGCVLNPVIKLLPEGLQIVLPLVHFHRTALVPVQEVIADDSMCQVYVGPGQP